MHKLVTLPSLLALAIGLSACSSQPSQDLEEARSAYSKLQSNPRSIELAALETQDAGRRLEQANQAFLSDADEEKVNQLAYLSKRATELAEQTIALRAAEERLMNIDQRRNEVRLESRDAQLQRSQAELQQSQAELQRRQQEIEQLRQSLDAKPTERGTLVTLGDLLFGLDSSQIRPDGMRDIQTLADFLKNHEGRKVVIEGHTDSTGSDQYNQQLSERRAQAVERALIRMGVDPSTLTTRGYGEQFPVATNETPAGRAANRRVEVTISDSSQPVRPRSQQNEAMGGMSQSGGMRSQDMDRMRQMSPQDRQQQMQQMQQRMQQMTPQERQQYQQRMQQQMQQMSPEERRQHQQYMQERMQQDPRMQQQMMDQQDSQQR